MSCERFWRRGTLTSLELEEKYAKVAHSNLHKAGFGKQVSYMTGAALQSLEILATGNNRFDFSLSMPIRRIMKIT